MATSENRRKNDDMASRVIICLFVFLAAALAWRLFVPSSRVYRDPVVSSSVIRGTVTDRDGRILAIETYRHDLFCDTTKLPNPSYVAYVVSPLLGTDPGTLAGLLSSGGNVLVKSNVTPTLAHELENYGFTDVISPRRLYPAGTLARSIVGDVDEDMNGTEGIEKSWNSVLSPDPAVGSEKPIVGQDIALSLDENIQFVLENTGSNGVLLDSGGEILAAVGMESPASGVERKEPYALGLPEDVKPESLLGSAAEAMAAASGGSVQEPRLVLRLSQGQANGAPGPVVASFAPTERRFFSEEEAEAKLSLFTEKEVGGVEVRTQKQGSTTTALIPSSSPFLFFATDGDASVLESIVTSLVRTGRIRTGN